MSEALRQFFGPQLRVTLANHPPGATQQLAAQFVVAAQVSIVLFVLFGRQFTEANPQLGLRLAPEFWAGLQEKRGALLMGAWFLGNMVRQNLQNTGAFEVYYDGG